MPYQLCYIDKCDDTTTMYFHSDFENATGDDWNDAPFNLNAGIPSLPLVSYYASGENKLWRRDWNDNKTPKFRVFTLTMNTFDLDPYYKRVDSFDGIFKTDNMCVNDINKNLGKIRMVPWLVVADYSTKRNHFYAGDNINKLKAALKKINVNFEYSEYKHDFNPKTCYFRYFKQ